MTYAATTDVSVDRTIAELKAFVKAHGGTNFTIGEREEESIAVVAFIGEERQVRIVLPLPRRDDQEVLCTPQGKLRGAAAATTAWHQQTRSRWRALFLIVKAKFESVETGIVTFEEEFLPHIVLPDGATVFQHTQPAIAAAYASGKVTPLLQIEASR